MRIALDARTVYRSNRRGTGKNLIDLYTHVLCARKDWEIVAFHRESEADETVLPNAQVQARRVEMPGDRFDAWQRYRLPFTAWKGGADVLHCPANHCPKWLPLPTVVTIHDLIPLDFPFGRSINDLKRFEQSVAVACERAARIITPSRYTRDRLVRDFGADAERIAVNEWAADSKMTKLSRASCEAVRRKYDLHGRVVLHFGANPSRAPRKNTRRVLEAWSVIPAAARRNWTLMIVGVDESGREELATIAKRLGVCQDVRVYDFAPEHEVPALMNIAKVLAYPSLSEGFGLPILDAWVAETAVLTSNSTSLPEVAGNAAHLIDPNDVCAIGNGLRKLMEDSYYRRALNEHGRERLAQYNWQATADRFIKVIDQVAGTEQMGRLAA